MPETNNTEPVDNKQPSHERSKAAKVIAGIFLLALVTYLVVYLTAPIFG